MSTYSNYNEKYPCNSYNKKKDCRVILECGKELLRALPTSIFDALDPTTGDKPIPLAEVNVDTRKLCNPCVKIEYSSVINTEITLIDPIPSITLVFRLVRKCKGEDEEVLRLWTYKRDPSNSLTTEDTFTVTFCECFDHPCCDDISGKCCTYTVELVQADG